MRLTNYIREAFVRSVMNDVPSIDYAEQLRTMVNKKVAAIHKKGGIQSIDAQRLSGRYICLRGANKQGSSVTVFVKGLIDTEQQTLENDPEIMALADLEITQGETRDILRKKIYYAIKACSTRKQAVEALPEFEKYLPEDEAKAMRSVPAIANVLGDFVKAGWPKGQKKCIVTTPVTTNP